MRQRIEAAFAASGHLLYRNAWPVIAGSLLLVAGLATQLPRLEIDTSTESFLSPDDPIRATYERFRDEFGRDERIVIAVETPEIFDLAFLERLRRLHRDLEKEVPKVQEVQSLVNARNTRGEGDALVVEDLLERWPETPAELAAIRARALANPLYRDLLISRDGHLTTLLIETDAYSSLGVPADALAGFADPGEPGAVGAPRPPFLTGEENSEINRAVQAVVERYRAPDFPIYVAGSPILHDHLMGSMLRDMPRFTALALVTIAACLAFLFRSAAGVILPLLVAVLSLVTTLSLMVALGVQITLPIQILPSFLLAIGVGGSVHLLVIFFQKLAGGSSREDALARALGHSGLAIVMTNLTTAGGLASFASASLAPLAAFGVVGPVGTLLCLAFTLVLLPALLAVFPLGRASGRRALQGASLPLLARCGDLAVRRARFVVVVSAGILALALLGALQLRFSHFPLEWFPRDDIFRVASEKLNEELRGMMYLEVLVDSGQENGLHDPSLLNRLDAMRRSAASLQQGDLFVGKTVSLADVVKEIHQALNEERPEFYAIPEDRALVAQELLLFENSGSDDLEDVVDPLFRKARFTLKIPFVDALVYRDFLEVVESRFREILGPGVSVTMTGLMALFGRTFAAVGESMIRSYAIAFCVITLLMMLLIGRVRMGLLAMVPNFAPILVTLGLMGWAGIPLDLFTMLIGSIAIGLAVDDTIHFLHNFRRYHEEGRGVAGSVAETLRTAGQAMLFTSVVLASGFFLFAFSSLRNLANFGLLTGFTILVAFLADMLLTPALLALAYGRGAARSARAAACLFPPALALLAGAPAAAQEPSGRQIMELVDARDDGDNGTQDMKMTLTDKGGGQRVREIRSFRRDIGPDTQTILFFLAPADVKDTGFLTYDYDEAEKDDDQWLYLPALKKTKRIAAGDKSGSFMGSDFSYADMTDRPLDHYEYTLLKETEVEGVPVWQVRAVPITEREREETGYQESILFVRKDNHVLIRALHRVAKGERLKYFDVKKLELVDGIWVPTEMQMTTRKGEVALHKTVLSARNVRFNQDLPADLFSLRALEKGL